MKQGEQAPLEALINGGNDDHVMAKLLEAVIEDPQDTGAFVQLALLFVRGGRLVEARSFLQRALHMDPQRLEALWALYEVEQALDRPEEALKAQASALALKPVISVATAIKRTLPAGIPQVPISVLMLCAPGLYQANTPLEYIADGARLMLHKWYLEVGVWPELPPFDVAFTAIGHGPGMEELLAHAQAFVEKQSCIVINEPKNIALLARDTVAEIFADSRVVLVAPIDRMIRQAVMQQHMHEAVLIRPLGSQAGQDFALLQSDGERDTYLQEHASLEEFYLLKFIDYKSDDGYYRKYRIVFIDGVAFPVHLAISDRWMVHYYNALMAEHKWMREEEARFMRDMSAVFHGIAAHGLEEIARLLPFEYFAIDCSIAKDGRVVLFEADTAMLVHQADPIEMYPYKHECMPRIIDAVTQLFESRLPSIGYGVDRDENFLYDA